MVSDLTAHTTRYRAFFVPCRGAYRRIVESLAPGNHAGIRQQGVEGEGKMKVVVLSLYAPYAVGLSANVAEHWAMVRIFLSQFVRLTNGGRCVHRKYAVRGVAEIVKNV